MLLTSIVGVPFVVGWYERPRQGFAVGVYAIGTIGPAIALLAVALAFVWLSILAAIMSFSKAKWLPTAGAFARFLLLGLFMLTVIIFAVKHGAHGLGAASYSPTAGGFVLLVGVLLFNFVGFELPNSAGEEMTNPQRDVPFAVVRSGSDTSDGTIDGTPVAKTADLFKVLDRRRIMASGGRSRVVIIR